MLETMQLFGEDFTHSCLLKDKEIIRDFNTCDRKERKMIHNGKRDKFVIVALCVPYEILILC